MPANIPESPYTALEKGAYRLRRPSVATPLRKRDSAAPYAHHAKRPSAATRARTRLGNRLAVLLVALLLGVGACFAFAYYLWSET
jgi:hypothetical protein